MVFISEVGRLIMVVSGMTALEMGHKASRASKRYVVMFKYGFELLLLFFAAIADGCAFL